MELLTINKNVFREFKDGVMVFPGIYLNKTAAYFWESSLLFGDIKNHDLKMYLLGKIKNNFQDLPPDSVIEKDLESFIDGCIRSGLFESTGNGGRQSHKNLAADTNYIPKAELVLTHNCNFRCRHCFIEAKKEIADEMSIKQWEVVLKKLLNMGLIHLILSGGEPGSCRHLADILKLLEKGPNLFINILTNGSLMGATNLIEQLGRFSGGVNMQISLNSVNEEGYKQFTGQTRHSLSETLTNIKRLISAGIRPKIITQVNSENIESILNGAFIETLDKLGVKHWVIQPYWRSIGRALSPGSFLQVDAERSHRFVRDLERNRKRFENEHDVKIVMDSVASLTYGTDFYIDEYSYSACKGYSNSIAVNSDGEIYSCSEFISFGKNAVGNVLNLSEEEIITSLHSLKVLMREEVASISGICASCGIKGTCKGGCRADAFGGGEKDGLSPRLCEILRQKNLFPEELLTGVEAMC